MYKFFSKRKQEQDGILPDLPHLCAQAPKGRLQGREHSLEGQELVIQHPREVCFILAPEREESRKGNVPGLHRLQRLGKFQLSR